MTKSVEVHHVGDTRRVVRVLKPGKYELGDGAQLVLKRPATMELTERFGYQYPSLKRDLEWLEHSWHHDTLKIIPTAWERVLAFFWRKPALPRAVLINTRKS